MSKFENIPLGWARQLEDWDKLEATETPFQMMKSFTAPHSVSFRKIYPSTRNQGQAGSCTAFARTRASTVLTYWQTGQIVEYSPLWAYERNQARSNIRGIMSGATIGATLESMNEDGEVLEKSYPYDLRKYGNKLPQELFEEGQTRQALKHSPLKSPEEIFQWLASGKGAVIIGIDWTKKLANAGKYLDDAGSGSYGGHAMEISGYDGDELDEDGNPRFELDNSHGKEWAIDGTTLVSWRVVRQWQNQRWTDMRGVTDLETPDIIRPFPSADILLRRKTK